MSQVSSRQAKKLSDYKAPEFTITDVELSFELNPEATLLTAVYQLQSTSGQAATLILDGQELKLLSVSLDGQLLNADCYQVTAEQLILPDMPAKAQLELKIELNPKANTALEGLYLSNGAYCTQCEAEGFRRISYYLDRPDVLARFTTHIIADDKSYPALLSNGNLVSSTLLPDGRRHVTWVDPFPKPSYLFALVAGDFDCLKGSYTTCSGREVALEFYVDKGNKNRAQFALESLQRAMLWDEQTFGLEYDLDIYMVVAVDFFNMGAMENKGLNVFNSKYVLADQESATDTDFFNIESIIGHEYFHNWTGNRVTCRDWFQLSLKEGLTVFRDQQFSADMGSATLNRIDAVKTIRTAQFAEDAGPMAHPIRPQQVLEMNNFYTVTVYDKGAEVIRMLHTLLGQDGFRKGMDLYFKRHDGQAVTCDDFVNAMQDANKRDLTLFRRWYQQSGTPELKVHSQFDAKKREFKLLMQQHTPATADQAEKEPLLLPVRVELLVEGVSLPYLLEMTQQQQEFSFAVSQKPVPVLLADFSAPVKLQYQYSMDELLQIARVAKDGVARWDAIQQLWQIQVKAAIEAKSSGAEYQLPAALFEFYRQLLVKPLDDLAFTAELLTVPAYDMVAEQFDEIPVQDLVWALQSFQQQLATELKDQWQLCYQSLQSEAYQYQQQQVAKRALRSVCLHYLAFVAGKDELLRQQYNNSDNMTDQLAVLRACRSASHPLFAELMSAFELRWNKDVLVLDKWFSLSASYPQPSVFATVQQLTAHPQFSWQNPNRVRAVFGAFYQQNPAMFHSEDGQGYQLLADVVLKMDAINPQVASRLVTPLLSWKRYQSSRQLQLKSVLQTMLNKELSNDLYEKVSKSLS
ncbi:aminopeptidase N [Rheinheimera sp. 1928-s]|uniref:aminopeptidase N n=1 Tax=Rheinheimera sp. 1928-s TaxID=3033803 RepID=UPI0026199158|nr:aminopeptidase N [Rheinheimera sp. 1928-s]MDF3126622.1 aminopeptidase N [Rheinheimera sp. 1928-s]